MKCYNHPDVDAVGQCTSCSKGLCKECADKFDMFDSPICLTCASAHYEKEYANMKSRLAEIKSLKVKSILLVSWSIVLIFLGIISFLTTGASADAWFKLMFFFAIAGLPYIIYSSIINKKTVADELKNIRTAVSSQNNQMAAFFGKMIGGFIVSAIAAPLITAYAIYNYSKLLKEETKLKAELEECDNAA